MAFIGSRVNCNSLRSKFLNILCRLYHIRLNDRHTEACNQFVQDHIGKELTEDSGLSIQFNANREIRHGVKTLAKSIDIWARMQQLQDPAELPAELVVAPK